MRALRGHASRVDALVKQLQECMRAFAGLVRGHVAASRCASASGSCAGQQGLTGPALEQPCPCAAPTPQLRIKNPSPFTAPCRCACAGSAFSAVELVANLEQHAVRLFLAVVLEGAGVGAERVSDSELMQGLAFLGLTFNAAYVVGTGSVGGARWPVLGWARS